MQCHLIIAFCHDLAEYLEFSTLANRISDCVQDFALYYGSDEPYECTESGIMFEEWKISRVPHASLQYIFRNILLIKVPDGASGTYFKRPDMGAMLPPKNKVQPTPLNQDTIAPHKKELS